MLRLLRFLFTGSLHEHRWKTIQEALTWGSSKDRPDGITYFQQCEQCGVIKRRDL